MPRARTNGLDVQKVGDEVLVYDRERDRAHCLNPQAALVWRHCDGRTAVATVASRLSEHYRLPAEVEAVRFALARLERAHLIEKREASPDGAKAPSRRELLKKLGVAATAALPVVTSLVAPSPAHAMSCLPRNGCAAGVNDCAPCDNPGGNCGTSPWRCCGGVCRPPGVAKNLCGC